MSAFRDSWWPEKPLRWALFFAAVYILLFLFSDMLTPLWEVVPDRVSLVYLPAFVRVVAVLIAGLAGALGVSIGSFLVCVLFLGDSASVALGNASASAAGIVVAYAIILAFHRSKQISYDLRTLASMILIYSVVNAALHGLFWNFLGIDSDIHFAELAMMAFGDLAGVVLLFYLSRVLLRTHWIRSLLARSTIR
jgi:hypothetical protein